MALSFSFSLCPPVYMNNWKTERSRHFFRHIEMSPSHETFVVYDVVMDENPNFIDYSASYLQMQDICIN